MIYPNRVDTPSCASRYLNPLTRPRCAGWQPPTVRHWLARPLVLWLDDALAGLCAIGACAGFGLCMWLIFGV